MISTPKGLKGPNNHIIGLGIVVCRLVFRRVYDY